MTMRRDEALASTRDLLEQNGVASPMREARLILCGAAGLTAADLIRDPDALLDEPDLARLRAMTARRAAREPLSRILGRREFWSLDLAIDAAALDPRADTETLVSAALAAFASRRGEALRVLDLGTGSGAILCALLKELPNASGIGVDLSPEAAAIARANLAACGLAERSRVIVGSWGDCLAPASPSLTLPHKGGGNSGPYDLIVSNPPYIATGEIAGLDPEVRDHDPHLALDGGADGLEAYRALAPVLIRLLKASDGRFFFEIGARQSTDATTILADAGLRVMKITIDAAGLPRVIGGAIA